jgi:uncharacterized membrane protein
LDHLERRLSDLTSRLEWVEGQMRPRRQTPAAPPPQVPPPPLPESPPRREPVRSAPAASGTSFEEVLGGRVLAWIGGLAILLGTVLFLGMAISHGWIDEPTRTVLAFLGSTALLVAGVWLHERGGRFEAALAAVASGVSGLFATIVVATQVYDLIAPGVGLAMAALVAAVSFAMAVRWSAPLIGALGTLGALAAPMLAGVGTSGVSIAFVAIALAASSAILVWQRWNWLALGAFLVSAPQLIAWVVEARADQLALTLAVAVGFWVLYAAAAFGHELRVRGERQLPISSWLLLFASTAMLTALGYFMLEYREEHSLAVAWLLGVSGSQIAFGAAALRLRIHREIGSLLIALGLGISALTFAAAFDGPVLVIGWAVEAIVLAYLATGADDTPSDSLSNAERLAIASAGLLGAAFGHVLLLEAPPTALFDGVEDLRAALLGIGASSAAAVACALLARRTQPLAAQVAGFAGAAGLVYLGSVAIVDTVGVTASGEARQAGQVWLSAFWGVTGLGAILYGLLRRIPDVRLGGLALLALAIGKVYIYDLSELDELARVLSFVALGLLLLVGAFAYQRLRVGADEVENDVVPR